MLYTFKHLFTPSRTIVGDCHPIHAHIDESEIESIRKIEEAGIRSAEFLNRIFEDQSECK